MPSVIRGSDDFDSDEYGGLGHNQTWQNVTASRTDGVTYTNTTGKPIYLSVRVSGCFGGGSYWQTEFVIDGTTVFINSINSSSTLCNSPASTIIVPKGSTYKVLRYTAPIAEWFELR